MAKLDPNITRVPVAVQSDFMKKQASATPLEALAECIWNSLDADATKVEVEIVRDVLGIQSITIRDNGTGMTREKAPKLFSKLGDSGSAGVAAPSSVARCMAARARGATR